MSELGEAAAELAERDVPVFPVVERGKRPACQHGLNDATTDIGCVRRWWDRHPDYNIGIRTGVVFDVLDLDGDDALDALDALAPDEAGPVVGPMVMTGNGVHIYVRPTGRGNTAGIGPGVDWRGIGGYVIAPPSIHPSGATYRWLDTYGPDTPLARAPAWLLEAWDRRRRPDPGTERRCDPSRSLGTAYGRKALDAECGRLIVVQVGQRNDALNRAAYSLGQLVAGAHLDRQEVARHLLIVADHLGLSASEAVPTIRSGLAAGVRSPRRPVAQ